ncbi:MAG: FadR family transcriptional regulator [Phycisphaerae bacterium]|nr:FadR family transcriptional regulator [Phycisphaerae bacterium]
MNDKTVKRKNLSEEVASRIKSYIIENSLRMGDRLPTEFEFAELFGVSRVIIREATKALGFLGILNSAPKRGLTVGEVDMKRVTQYLGFHFALNDYPREKLLKTRMILEVGALGEVIEKMARDPEIYSRFRGIISTLETSRDADEFIRHDMEFHRALIEASDIDPLVAFNDLLDVFFRRFREEILEVQGDWKVNVQGHRNIIDALRDGKLTEAQELIRLHLSNYKKAD